MKPYFKQGQIISEATTKTNEILIALISEARHLIPDDLMAPLITEGIYDTQYEEVTDADLWTFDQNCLAHEILWEIIDAFNDDLTIVPDGFTICTHDGDPAMIGVFSESWIQCDCCGDYFDNDQGGTYNADGEPVCEGCEESEWSSASICVEINPNEEPVTMNFSGNLGRTIIPSHGDIQDSLPEPIKGEQWKSSGGYRGAMDVTLKDDYSSLTSGWSTGSWDDVPWKHSFNDFCKALTDETITPPATLWIILQRTSNVFSTSTDIVCRDEDMDAIIEWLNSTPFTLEKLHNSLG
jgi:hypothetical protein